MEKEKGEEGRDGWGKREESGPSRPFPPLLFALLLRRIFSWHFEKGQTGVNRRAKRAMNTL